MLHRLNIHDKTIEAISPEGQTASMTIADLVARAAAVASNTGAVALPPGVVHAQTRGGCTVWVHQTQPQTWNLKWIAPGSKRNYGGAEYRDVILSLPYIITIAVFFEHDGQPRLSASNECFFRNGPLKRLDEGDLLVPGLLNCSVFGPVKGKDKIGVDGKSLVWICTQNLKEPTRPLPDHPDLRRAALLDVLYDTLLAMGFNYSSERHEYSSGFSESADIICDAAGKTLGKSVDGKDKKVAAIEAWQAATAKDQRFGLGVPWHKTGYTVMEAVERIFRHANATPAVHHADDVARIIFNSQKKSA